MDLLEMGSFISILARRDCSRCPLPRETIALVSSASRLSLSAVPDGVGPLTAPSRAIVLGGSSSKDQT